MIETGKKVMVVETKNGKEDLEFVCEKVENETDDFYYQLGLFKEDDFVSEMVAYVSKKSLEGNFYYEDCKEDLDTDKVVILTELFTLRNPSARINYRNQGYGSALFKFALDLFKDYTVLTTQLEFIAENMRVGGMDSDTAFEVQNHLAEKFGFEETTEIYKSYEDRRTYILKR